MNTFNSILIKRKEKWQKSSKNLKQNTIWKIELNMTSDYNNNFASIIELERSEGKISFLENVILKYCFKKKFLNAKGIPN